MKSYGCRQCFCPSHPLSTAFWEKVDIHCDFNSMEVLMLTLSLQNAILKAFPGTGSYWQGVIDQYCTYNQWLADFCLLLLFYLIIRQTMWSFRGMTICGDDRGWWRGSSWQGHQDETFLSTPLTWNYLGSIFSIPGILEWHDYTYDFVVTQKGVKSSTSMIFKYYPMSESVNIYEWLS